jgi:hypothetical protein
VPEVISFLRHIAAHRISIFVARPIEFLTQFSPEIRSPF